MLTLSVIQGPDAGKRFALPPNEPQLIGRSSEALPLGDNTVSRRHAELTPDAGNWYIRDLSSQNGTYLNGVQLSKRVRLLPGDQVRVGQTVFVFGQAADEDPSVIRLVRDDELNADIEHRLASNEDSLILAEPEPNRAAVEHLRVVYRLVQLTSRQTRREDLLNAVMELVFEEFRPERGVVMMDDQDDPRGALHPVAVRTKPGAAASPDEPIRVSRTILNAAISDNDGVLSTNAMGDPRFASHDSVQSFQVRSAICSPVRFGERTFGAIYIDSSIANYTFVPAQLALLNAIGQHTGLALANLEAADQRVHAERLAAMGETVASLSHSIKNILQGLRGGADVLEMGLNRDDLRLARNGWSILQRNLDRIVGLTMNMLAFGRPREPEFTLTPLQSLVQDAADLLEPVCSQRGVALIVDADSDVPPVAIDSNLVHQALMNLLGNAADAAPEKTGVVTVRVSYHEPTPEQAAARPTAQPHARISVTDNGPGIQPERLRWIFEPFHTTKGLRGTGLGLAVTKRIVDEHRGRLTVDSAPGKGAVFTMYLPASTAEAMDPSQTHGGGV